MSSLKAIKTLRKRGYQKRGKLKFISELSALNLKQYGKTHEIRSSTKMKIQGVSGLVKVLGLQQLRGIKDVEFANAKLLNTPKGYYVALTCYVKKETRKGKTNGKVIGLDFGCQTSITDSEGNKTVASFGESERLKRLQRRLNRLQKGSNRRRRLIKEIRKEHQKIGNRKLDFANKFVAGMKDFDRVVIQDENLSGWQKGGHGKAVQHSCLGLVKAKLKALPNVTVLDRWIPTTKLCRECGTLHDRITQADRTFSCPACEDSGDRDVHAAQNMVWIYENLVGRDAAEFTLAEYEASAKAFFAEGKRSHDETRSCSVFS